MTRSETARDDVAPPAFGELVETFAKIGAISFGGAAGQIALMHALLVDEKKWLSEARFRHALSYCMLLPGPEAQQLATYVGWLMHGVRGGLVAGLLFVIPGALVMLALSALYVLAAGIGPIEGLFFGIKAAVLAIVIQALLRIARRGLTARALYLLAALSFAGILFLDISFPLIVIGAGAIGLALAAIDPRFIGLGAGEADAAPARTGSARGALIAALWCLAAWWAPVMLAALALGPQHLLVEIGLFFGKLAVVTFGGAYALLAYLSQAAVEAGWVTTAEMIDGLGLAETTPGPTILVNQFVAFLGGHRSPEPFPPLIAASLAALMAVWTTFAPSFLWIFAGAPLVEVVRKSPLVAGALAGITAAVVGVIGYLALWFGAHVLFREVGEAWLGPIRVIAVAPLSLDLRAALLSAAAFAILFLWKRGVAATVAILAAAGIAIRLLGV